MPSLETDILFDLIRSKRACLEQLRLMGLRQMEVIEADQMTALLDLLAHKQNILGELQQIEHALNPFRNQAPESRRWRSEEARRQCAEALQECESLLAEIIGREQSSEEALVRRRDKAADALQGMHRAGQARASYNSLPAGTVTQLDLCSDIS